MEANHVYMNRLAEATKAKVEYKIGNKWVEFNNITTREAVLPDSLFLRYMERSITRNSGDISKDFIVLKFNYDVDYRINGIEQEKVDRHILRDMYYQNGVAYRHIKKNKQGKVKDEQDIHYKMLMRTPGKAKDGECIFIRESLHHKAISYLTMGLYDLMDEQAKNDPNKVFKLVELSAYLTLTTATAIGYVHIPLENILIVNDEEIYSDEMSAAIVRSEDVPHLKDTFCIDFDNPKTEEIINKKGFTFYEDKAIEKGLELLTEKSKEALKQNGIRINGKYPGWYDKETFTKKECVVRRTDNAKIKNVVWDGMGVVDESIFPKKMNGFIYLRSHFFKSCLFRGDIQTFFRDYCEEHGMDYYTYTMEKVDMFERPLKLSDIKVIITDKSIKWLKFIDLMGGTEKKAYRYYRKIMNQFDDVFSIVKTAHASKWGNQQLMAYQMANSLPTTDRKILGGVVNGAVDFYNELKTNDEAYLDYLNTKKNNFNINELLIALVKWNPDFVKTEFFRKKKTQDLNKLKDNYFKLGKLLQEGDNLTIMDNPIALLLKAIGDNPLNEACFEVAKDGVQCYAPRFENGERIAAFRSPHNSPENIIHLYNVYPDKLLKYFPHIGQNVIVFNAIKTDTQPRLSGHDVDSDFIFATNQKDVVDLARIAYTKYPTIINEIEETSTSGYHFTLADYADMDNKIADAQESIGTSTDTAQLALSYYYDGRMESKELEDCFIILSVLGQISIDLAKKSFDIDVVNEIRRIKQMACMKNNNIPLFYATIKQNKNNKKFPGGKVRSMNCPMDIMAELIDEKVIPYGGRISHKPLRDFWNQSRDMQGKGNRYKKKKVIEEAERYNTSIKKIESNKENISEDIFFSLKNRMMMQFLNRVKFDLEQETVMQLVIYATSDGNMDVRSTILNFLFNNYNKEFMNCFIKKCAQNEQKIYTEAPKIA